MVAEKILLRFLLMVSSPFERGALGEADRAVFTGQRKIFPSDVLGPSFIKAVHGSLPHLEMVAVGGVSSGNLEGWFKAGAYAVGLGSALTKKMVGRSTIKQFSGSPG